MLEAQVGGLLSEASPGKSSRPYLKNKLKQEGQESMVQVVECLVSTDPRFKPQYQKKEKRDYVNCC
jgi:hypothetical protein